MRKPARTLSDPDKGARDAHKDAELQKGGRARDAQASSVAKHKHCANLG
jgi:hypothetical protein